MRATCDYRTSWATECLDCGDGLRLHPDEATARSVYERDTALERNLSVPERHRMRLLRGEMVYRTVDVTICAYCETGLRRLCPMHGKPD